MFSIMIIFSCLQLILSGIKLSARSVTQLEVMFEIN
jgi:hypothetical protein